MLQARASTLTMPPFGHNLSLTGVQKVEGYGDADAWNWPPPSQSQSHSYAPVFDPAIYASFAPQPPVPGSVQARHHSIATSHVINTGTSTPPPPRQQIAGSMIKAQPAFKPTWNGFLDTTKDAMTIVEAALQGRLSHISRRPHDKERAEMLTSGTVLVYEENASGIKRWTDAVHWSPSRVMNNCLIYRQLVRALKPEEKKSALNPSCGGKRKRKESAGPSITKTGENVNNSEDEFDNPGFDGALAGDVTPTDSMGKVYANFAQSLTPDQQRRFCGSLIDSYEFKEGGLMKKTISVKYQGTTHHIISYYSLEDVVAGKLKRPFQDPKLADIQPRPELLTGWKVSLEDEESKDMPLVAGYPHQLPASHIQHQGIASVTQGLGPHGMVQPHTPLHLQVPEYWHGGQVAQYTPTHQSPQHYAPPQSGAPQYASQQPPSQQYSSQQSTAQPYQQAPSPQHYSSQNSSAQQYPSPATSTHHYPPSQPSQPYSSESQVAPGPQYTQQQAPSQYPAAHHDQVPQSTPYTMPQAPVFDLHVPIHSSSTPGQQPSQSPLQQHDPHRRASAPVGLQTYSQGQYQAAPQQQSYYVPEHKYSAGQTYGY